MEKFEIFNSEHCYMCWEFMDFKCDLTVAAGYSEKSVYQLIETIGSVSLGEEIMNECGVCQSCFVKLNEYDEHLSIAEQIQTELLGLMDNKFVMTEEEYLDDLTKTERMTTVKEEEDVSVDAIDYEPYEPVEEELLLQSGDETEGAVVETLVDECQFEIVVDDTKENKQRRVTTTAKSKIKLESPEILMIETEDHQKMYQCDICFKVCKDKSKLRSHREIHTDERNVICPICSKAFKTMNCLRNHKRLHVPERIYYNCDRCDKKYTQKVQLKKHIEIVHMQRRDFICPTCGACFGTNSVLKMHQLSHQDFRAEKCEVCGFRFHTKAKLRRHMKSHTGERNYECTICFKKFLYSYNVVAHVRNVHDKKPGYSSCQYCSESFDKAGKLAEHLRQAHEDIIIKDGMDHHMGSQEALYDFEKESLNSQE